MLRTENNAAQARNRSSQHGVPVVTTEGNAVKVEVGSAQHPMTEKHRIQWGLSPNRQRRSAQALEGERSPSRNLCPP